MAHIITGRASKTRRRIAQARLLLQRGMSRAETIATLMDENDVSRTTAIRTVDFVDREATKELNLARGALTARQWRKLDHMQRLALQAQKAWVTWKNGKAVVHHEAAPDLAAFGAAVAQQSKLAGLNAPDRKEVMLVNVAEMIRDMVEIARDYIPDVGERKRFVEALSHRLEERKKERPALVPADVVEVRAEPAEAEDAQPGPSGNGKNGT